MEQWTGSKLGEEYVKAEYCHTDDLAYTHNSSSSSLVAKSCLTLETP